MSVCLLIYHHRDYVLPPILQYSSGHLVCISCRSKLTCCPTCCGSLANICNLAMEKVAWNVKFPWKHSSKALRHPWYTPKKVNMRRPASGDHTYLCPCPDDHFGSSFHNFPKSKYYQYQPHLTCANLHVSRLIEIGGAIKEN